MTQYEFNQMIMSGMQKLDDEFVEVMINGLVKSYLEKHNSNKYFLLLNRETYDFTMFAKGHSLRMSPNDHLLDELMLTVFDRGELKSIALTEDEEALIFWVDDKAYYFFEYDKGVIEI